MPLNLSLGLSLAGVGGPNWMLSGASLDMDFAGGRYFGGTVDSLISTTRASTGYAQTSSGLLVPFASNVPRITDQGLLVEEARTNSGLYSQNAFGGGNYSRGSVSVTDGTLTAPDQTATGSTATASAGTGQHYFYQTAGYTATAAAWTASIYAKAGTTNWLGLSFGSNANVDGAYFNLQTGVVGTVQAGTTATITALGNGWYRCAITKTLTATTRYISIEVHSADNQVTNWNAAGTESISVWGGQAELGAFPTSYIPTTTASATRAADVITLTGAAATAALAAKAAYFETNLVAGGSNPRLLEYGGSATAYFPSTTTVAVSNNAGANTATATLGSGTYGGLVKTAFGMDATSLLAKANGGTQAINANAWSGNTGTVYIFNRAAGDRALNGYGKRLAFGPVKDQFVGNAQ